MKAKIITRIVGGLGNQLFCYAAGRRLALANDAELVIDHISGFDYDTRYRRSYQLHHFNISCRLVKPYERLVPFSRIRRAVKKRVARLQPFEKRSYIIQQGMDFDERLLHLKPSGTLYLEGYWQGEGYFKEYEEVIRDDLRLSGASDHRNLEVMQTIRKSNAVAVHIRFFEDPKSSINQNLTIDYYRRAIREIEKRTENAHYILFSDKPEAVGELMESLKLNYTLADHNKGDDKAHLDLWLMSNCNHFIIPNSTFGWWGAWLSEYPDKIVIAPALLREKGTGLWGFKGLLPDEWILV